MKKLIFIIFFVSSFYNCKAQRSTVAIENQEAVSENGFYYKDINHYLDPFVGTWIYTNGTTSLKIVLRKVIKNYNGHSYKDILVGEYKYIENGVEKINTLSELNADYSEQANHSIRGNRILNANDNPVCNDCEIEEKRVLLFLGDPVKEVGARVFTRFVLVGGQPALSILMHSDGIKYLGITADDYATEFAGSTMPNGTYTLMKQ